jgi:hypothetical protein
VGNGKWKMEMEMNQFQRGVGIGARNTIFVGDGDGIEDTTTREFVGEEVGQKKAGLDAHTMN